MSKYASIFLIFSRYIVWAARLKLWWNDTYIPLPWNAHEISITPARGKFCGKFHVLQELGKSLFQVEGIIPNFHWWCSLILGFLFVLSFFFFKYSVVCMYIILGACITWNWKWIYSSFTNENWILFTWKSNLRHVQFGR